MRSSSGRGGSGTTAIPAAGEGIPTPDTPSSTSQGPVDAGERGAEPAVDLQCPPGQAVLGVSPVSERPAGHLFQQGQVLVEVWEKQAAFLDGQCRSGSLFTLEELDADGRGGS